MTINFALSLSHEGIEMLQRVHDGWRRLGHVDINSPTLNADLTSLQTQAEVIASSSFCCKIIIPADQIKYTAIESDQTDKSDIDAVLKNATPYSLDALVVDFERSDGNTHIAAVARQTLQEAENFAAMQGFRPVAFVAVPPASSFQSEVFFGPTSAMPDILGPDATVTRDSQPVQLVGKRLESRKLVRETAPKPETKQVLWVDATPPEVWRRPTPALAVQAPTPQKIALAQPPLFDPIIAEVSPNIAAKPALVAAGNTSPVAVSGLTDVPPAPVTDMAAISRKKLFIGLAASVAVLAMIGGWALLATGSGADAPTLLSVETPASGAAAPEIALQSAPDLGPNPPAEVAPFDSTIATDDPVMSLLSEVTSLPAPEIENAPPQAPLIGPEVLTVAAPLFGEFAATAPNLPAGMTTQEPSPAIGTPILVQAILPDASIAIPQDPPSAPFTEDRVTGATATARGTVPSPAEAAASYEATGVWQRSPRLIDTPSGAILLGFMRPAPLTTPPRVAAPVFAVRPAERPVPFAAPRNPPPADMVFARDENGFIAATPEGTLTPDGAFVIAGLPDLAVSPRPQLSEADLARLALLAPAAPDDGVVVIAGTPDVIPPLRPANLVVPQAQPEAPLGGVGLAGLELQQSGTIALDAATVEARAATDLRPQLRPAGLTAAADPDTTDITDILREIAASDATLRFDNSTALAVRVSMRPDVRPNGLSRRPTGTTTAAPVVAAAPVAPQNFAPLPGAVARTATQEDVIRLRDINLIGVYGRPNARRALVRLSNGRYVRVEVGSALDGGQVTAIGDEALNYVKRGRTYAVEMPRE
ncbi:hypothetical protein [Yoonia sp.]|uniref:hypothetical protein n=1 Tax=Yoonia sp. TaxID=2212373 RepID=UPI0035C872DA